MSPELHESLRSAFQKLKDDQADSPDWHPNTNETVQDLVHPSMYPLVYGQSRVVREELVGVSNSIKQWSGKGDVIEKPAPPSPTVWGNIPKYFGGHLKEFWSDTYQWLPANVAFQEDGTVKFTSYINNLHPVKYASVYRTIEELIATALPMWDQCLAEDETEGAGRTESRMPFPDEVADDNPENWIPPDLDAYNDTPINFDDYPDADVDSDMDEEEKNGVKWEILRIPRIPEVPLEIIGSYAPEEDTKLCNKFRDSGLQVIVKMASIELTPEKPDFPAGGWHVEGQMNEHIAGTALYYVDSENVTSNHISFRVQTDDGLKDEVEHPQGEFRWMEHIFGHSLTAESALQSYGNVETQQGRLLAFPNVFHHRVSPFSLVDKTKPGHRRFIALWLVDPHQRIISTANVPPQQRDWWVDSILGDNEESRSAAMSKIPPEVLELMKEGTSSFDHLKTHPGELPPEMMEIIRGYFNDGDHGVPMSVEEAEEHRRQLMEVRGAFGNEANDYWRFRTYNFCEH